MEKEDMGMEEEEGMEKESVTEELVLVALGPEMKAMLGRLSPSSTEAAQWIGARYFRNLMSKKPKAVGGAVVQHLIPALLRFLDPNVPKTTQTTMDVMWILNKILKHNTTHTVVEAGGAVAFVYLARTADGVRLRNLALSALSNMADHCDDCCAQLADLGFLELLHEILATGAATGTTGTQAVSFRAFFKVCRHNEQTEATLNQIIEMLPLVVTYIGSVSVAVVVRTFVIKHMINLLYFLEDGNNLLIAAGSIDALIALLWSEVDGKILLGAVEAIMEFIAFDEQTTQAFIDAGIVAAINAVLSKTEYESAKIDVLSLLTQLMNGTSERIGLVLAEEGLMRRLVEMCEREEGMLRHYASWALVRAAKAGRSDQHFILVQEGCLGALCVALGGGGRFHYGYFIRFLLDAVNCFLDQPPFLLAFVRRVCRDAGLPARLQSLRGIRHRYSRRLAARLLFTHFLPKTKPAFTFAIPARIEIPY